MTGSETISELEAGTAFEVLEEVGDWWYVRTATESGWVQHLYCFINLPDVVPSIIYDNTNTYASKFTSSGKTIPGITGEALYDGKAYNMRLGKVSDIGAGALQYCRRKSIWRSKQLWKRGILWSSMRGTVHFLPKS